MFENNSSHHSVCRWLAVVPSFNLVFIFSGAKFRGEFEERLKAVLKEVQDANGQIVLFIDEIHTVVGAGAAEGGWPFFFFSIVRVSSPHLQYLLLFFVILHRLCYVLIFFAPHLTF